MTLRQAVIFYLVRLPFILGLIMAGFIMEFLVELPFRVLIWFHERFRGSAGKNK